MPAGAEPAVPRLRAQQVRPVSYAAGTLIERDVFYRSTQGSWEHWARWPRTDYLVSSWGRMCRAAVANSFFEPKVHKSTGRPYFMVDGQVIYIHHLVLEVFVGPRPTLAHHALHRDDDPLNNRLENLYWGTGQDNIRDRARNRPGWSQPTPKLTAEQVREIRARDNETTRALAIEYGVAHSTMRKILNRQTWKGIEP